MLNNAEDITADIVVTLFAPDGAQLDRITLADQVLFGGQIKRFKDSVMFSGVGVAGGYMIRVEVFDDLTGELLHSKAVLVNVKQELSALRCAPIFSEAFFRFGGAWGTH